MDFINQQYFNNREIAIGIWSTLFLLWAIYKKEIRGTLVQLIKSFFAWKLSFSYLAMSLYIFFIVYILYLIGIWDFSLTTSTLLWVAFGAYAMLFNFKKANDENFISGALKEHFKILVFLEFLINFYVFNIWTELILVPVFTIVGSMLAYSELKEEYEPTRKLFTFISASFGVCLSFYVILVAVKDFSDFATIENLQSFIVPIILSITFLPFVYFAALTINYEMLFTRLKFFAPEKSVLSYAKKKILFTCGLSLKRLNQWAKEMNNYYFDSTESVDEALDYFNSAQ